MALVKTRDVNTNNDMSGVTANKNSAQPSSRQSSVRPIIQKQTSNLSRPASNQSARNIVKKLPERQLLSRYRHVYAGKGGWFVSRTSLTPPVNFNSTPHSQYLDGYRKDIILRLSRDIFENSKQSLNKNKVVSNKVIGDQRGSTTERQKLTLELSNPHKSLLKDEDVPELTEEKDIGRVYEDDPDYKKSLTHYNGNKNNHTKEIDTRENDMKTTSNEKQYMQTKQEEDYVNSDLNVNDNCFITSFKRAHTIIGTIHPGDNQTNGKDTKQTEQNKQGEQEEHRVYLQENVSKDSNKSNIEDKNIYNINSVEISDIHDGNVKSVIRKTDSTTEKTTPRNKSKHALGELEFNVLRQRSFVRIPSKMAQVQQRPFSRGALTHSGKYVPRRMSQEALLAINETKKEMAIKQDQEDIDGAIDESGEQNFSSRTSPLKPIGINVQYYGDSSKFDNNVSDNHMVVPRDDKSTPPPSLSDDHIDSGAQLLQPSCESFNNTMDSKSPNGDTRSSQQLNKRLNQKEYLMTSSAEEVKQHLKMTSKTKRSTGQKGPMTTEATPISPDLGLVNPMTPEKKVSSARYSFNLSKERGSRHTNKRYFSSNVKISKDSSSISNQSNVFLNSPRTKLPHLKLASYSQEDVRKDVMISSRSRNSSRKLSPGVVHAEGDDKLAPLNSKKMPSWKYGGIVLTKEKSFQITPPGWDVRYKDIYGKKGHVDFNDDTPEEVKERAIEKCSDWLVKYM